METFEQFERELLEALNRLYDPDYRPSEALSGLLGCSAGEGAGAVQTALLAIIRGLEPRGALPTGGQPQNTFAVLNTRFVLKLTQEQTANALHVSVRTARREQRRGVHALAQVIWDNRLMARVARGGGGPEPAEQAPDWHRQLSDDLDSLRASSLLRVSDVAHTIEALLPYAEPLVSHHACTLSTAPLPEGLVVGLHPSALRQVLIIAIAQLAEHAPGAALSINAAMRHDSVLIDLEASGSRCASALEPGLIREILTNEGGSVEAENATEGARFLISLPWIGAVKVLVVDDNPDCVSYYQRCTVGTRYRIAHIRQADSLAQAAAEMAPDVILLDIMLPGLDGWDLLAQLRAAPATRDIPIIVCSIVAQEGLATMLGAVCCLPKPVQRRALLAALDQALACDPAPDPPSTAPQTECPSA